MQANRIQFLNCPIDAITMEQTVEQCLAWSRNPRQSHILVTVNVATLIMMRTDQQLREACVTADLIVSDGVPVLWACRWLNMPLKGRVAGVDLLARLLEVGSRHRLRVYFLGAKPEVLKQLVNVCHQQYSGVNIVGYQDGYFSESEHPRIISEIRNSGADFLFIGMPTPFKENWAHRYKTELNIPLILGVGGSFDVLAGFIRRAPRWMQNIGMEWFWRLMMEPGKLWKRYLVGNSTFIWLVLRESWSYNRWLRK